MKSAKQLSQSEKTRYAVRDTELRHMRIIATGLLIFMAMLFIVGNRLEHHYQGHWGFLRAFAEAAMVGGLADWFAVTALFRHPMGIPIPHTAIIPNNKIRIANTLAAFLRSNFLTTKVVARRIRNLDVAGAMGRFLLHPSAGEGRMRLGASRLLGDVLESLDDERMGKMVKSALKKQMRDLQIAPLLGQMLTAIMKEKRHVAVLDGIIGWSAQTLSANEQMIHDMVEERANAVMRWTGLDEKLANALVKGLNKMLAEMAVDPDHPLREKGEEGLAKLAHDLIHDKKTQKKVAQWKEELLDNPAISNWIDSLWQQAREALLKAANDPDASMAGQFGKLLTDLGNRLNDDPQLKNQINRFARRAIVGTTESYGDNIVSLVSDTIESWDESTLTDRVENAVGSDLQFIRINGTLVGGMAGLAIHAVGLWI